MQTVTKYEDMFENIDLKTLLKDCLLGSQSPYYLKYFDQSGLPSVLNGNAPFKDELVSNYLIYVGSLFRIYQIQKDTHIFDILKIIKSSDRKLDQNINHQSQSYFSGCCRCVKKIYLFLTLRHDNLIEQRNKMIYEKKTVLNQKISEDNAKDKIIKELYDRIKLIDDRLNMQEELNRQLMNATG
jgi:hypothetical protein